MLMYISWHECSTHFPVKWSFNGLRIMEHPLFLYVNLLTMCRIWWWRWGNWLEIHREQFYPFEYDGATLVVALFFPQEGVVGREEPFLPSDHHLHSLGYLRFCVPAGYVVIDHQVFRCWLFHILPCSSISSHVLCSPWQLPGAPQAPAGPAQGPDATPLPEDPLGRAAPWQPSLSLDLSNVCLADVMPQITISHCSSIIITHYTSYPPGMMMCCHLWSLGKDQTRLQLRMRRV